MRREERERERERERETYIKKRKMLGEAFLVESGSLADEAHKVSHGEINTDIYIYIYI